MTGQSVALTTASLSEWPGDAGGSGDWPTSARPHTALQHHRTLLRSHKGLPSFKPQREDSCRLLH